MNLFAVLRDAWFFFSHNLLFIVRLCLPLILVESGARLALGLWLGDADRSMHDMLAGMLFYPLYTGALILFLDARSRGMDVSPSQLLAMALQRWLPLALLVALSSLLIIIGASLFILPGIWVMVKLAFAEFLLIQRGLTPLAAMKESFALTRGRFLPVLNCVLVVIMPLWLLSALASEGLSADADPITGLAVDGLLGMGQLFGTVVFFRLFMMISSEPQKP
ncbi:hypothetical protein [Stutzerimonas tarimensis]|uniref:Uncharacterized protein n=1 Tax=Stutzerimonas tarimensis TaxID=1507735 RepID=A0ABV7T7Y9_9GAMM